MDAEICSLCSSAASFSGFRLHRAQPSDSSWHPQGWDGGLALLGLLPLVLAALPHCAALKLFLTQVVGAATLQPPVRAWTRVGAAWRADLGMT